MNPRARALIERHGWNVIACRTMAPGCAYLFPDDDACVAYVDTGRAWVAAGAPIAPAGGVAGAAAAFVAAARAAGRRACFFAAEDRLRGAVGRALHFLSIGEQPIWDPTGWPEVLASHRSLREQLRRARARGVTVGALSDDDLGAPATRAALAAVTDRWLETRGLPPMGFLLAVAPFGRDGHRRCFVARAGGRVVGFAGVVPLPARGGWFIEDLVRDPDAPNGTVELLIDAAMRAATTADIPWLTLGMAPLAGEVSRPLRWLRRGTRVFYDFEGLRAFRAKLRPQAWLPVHLAYPPTQGPFISIVDVLEGFAPGGLPRFGWQAVVRGTNRVARRVNAAVGRSLARTMKKLPRAA